ncbi:MAG TPA: hypothetical protein VGF69_09020 [Thermoanaerobaculia bacterium]|jgi:hypothetical protein
MTARALSVLLEGLIDYAGLFPPAKLPMEEAIRNYERYRESGRSWALGKFVVPATLTAEVPANIPLSVIAEVDAIPPRFRVLEMKASTEAEIARIAEQTEGRTVYVEVSDVGLIDAISQYELRAKIRTGGLTTDAFPTASAIANFMRTCRDYSVPFKATAGLHHPLRCIRPLTYEPDAPHGTMHGFVNVFLAAAMLKHAEEILMDDDPRNFTFDDEGAGWRGRRVSVHDLAAVRRTFATSFGSCSFEEPIADLEELGWL